MTQYQYERSSNGRRGIEVIRCEKKPNGATGYVTVASVGSPEAARIVALELAAAADEADGKPKPMQAGGA